MKFRLIEQCNPIIKEETLPLDNITFDNLEKFKDEYFKRKGTSRPKFYWVIGKFKAFDTGEEFVALAPANRIAEKTYLKFSNFIKSYEIDRSE